MTSLTAGARRFAAKHGTAMADGSYPIHNGTDLSNAVKDYYRTGKSPAVRAFIVKRVKALGLTGSLPANF